ncbi:invasion associated locus B family protein [Rhodoblastus sphagnicola]|uniref:invasion associated locus B family protein n=2 Tax=Rhodoblastus sphagnicola TaxID=333368 RepID=UPI0016140D3A|nr:invasion associated locus B family protein [Rhodoblastus sphagnicola]
MSFFPRRARTLMIGLLTASVCALTPTMGAQAKVKKEKPAAEKPSDDSGSKADKGKKDKKDKKTEEKSTDAGKTLRLGTFGEWGAYQTQGKTKTCYALAKPKSREPKALPREAAYVFISTRPAENVKNEISIIMGFPMKDGSEASAEIGSATFSLLAKGANAWVKNPAEESQFIAAMKKGSKLVVTADSIKGKTTTDTYVLTGLGQALDKVHKECP